MKLAPATPELAVRDLQAALAYYVDQLGFATAWHNEDGRIAGISHGDCAIFLRETEAPIHPVTLWIFTENVDAAHDALEAAGADIAEPLENRPWGLRQFTVRDRDGHLIHFHHDF